MNPPGLVQGKGAPLLAAAVLLSVPPAPVEGGPLRGVDTMLNPEDAMMNLQRGRSLQATSCLAESGTGLSETFAGPCTSSAISSAVSSAMAAAGASCTGVTLETELFALLGGGDAGAPTTAEGIDAALSDLCLSGFADASLPFGKVTKRGDQFDREFMNGGSDWNDQYEIDYEGKILHKLSDDADRVRIVHETLASEGPIEFPDYLTNFQGCEVGAAMCCYVSDRQNDADGECSGIGCSDSDPSSNTDVCYADMSNSPYSARVPNGFAVYHLNRDSSPAEGNVYCHGFAWDSADVESDSYRYRGNVLFDVAFKRGLYDRGYVQNVPGAPMCGCVEQMPVVTKADCSKLNSVTETWTVSTDAAGLLVADMTDADVSYGPCGPGEGLAESYANVNAGNDPSAISGRLVGDGGCLDAIDMAVSARGYRRSVLESTGAVGDPSGASVTVTFNAAVADSAADKDSYKIYEEADAAAELTVWSASLSADKKSITLVTDPQTAKTAYVIEIMGNVEKAVAPSVKLAVGSTIAFTGASYGYADNVAESANYTLVYSLDIPDKPRYNSGCPPYAFGDVMVKTFSKVAYWMELESPAYGHEFVWVSMDAFTADLDQIGVPTFDSGAIFQQSLGPVNIVSNQADVGTQTGVEASIEFWPNNYATQPSAASPAGANANTYDFGDTRHSGGNYGSMQIHSGGKTVFAFNNWNNGQNADLGIGNNPENSNPDWTFANSAHQYTLKKLQVLVVATSLVTDADRVPDGIAATIDDSEGYLMAYDLDIPLTPDYRTKVTYEREYPMTSGITRVAYFAELTSAAFGHQWVWVSMDAFTADASKTGVPCKNCGQGTIQEHVTNVNVVSNQLGFNGTALGGNVEFWPFDYGKVNTGAVREASNNLYDTGDEPSTGGTYGSMQIHVDDPSELNGPRNTIFAFNRWNSNSVADLGIGRRAVGEPDWTFSQSADEYTVRKLQVYVK